MGMLHEWLSRFRGTLGGGRRDADLEEELRLHLELAAEDRRKQGEPPEDAARAARIRAGSVSQGMDALRDRRALPWADTLVSDLVFGFRQLNKYRTASAAAIVSLGLAIGASTAAFRLVDAVLLRPLPVADPDRLFVVTTTFVDSDKRLDYLDDFDYPTYREYVRTVAALADLMVVGMSSRQPVMYAGGDEPETAFRQYVSGNVFGSFGLQPALGRLLTPEDDVTPGAHPVAVLSHEYWTRRFARNPGVIGTTFRAGNQQFEIVGVAPKGFTGTEPGSVTDLFMPSMMNVGAINSPGWSWFRIWVRPKPGTSAEQIRQMLQARFRADHEAQLGAFPADTPKDRIDEYLREEVRLLPAGSGASGVQKTFRRPLYILAALAALVLLVACANVSNLLMARGLARTREMALRMSIGAARWRLIQLLLIESALLAIFASIAGALFASWSAPVVASMLTTADRPVRLVFDVDWRAAGFGVGLALAVTIFFGLAPALRASSVQPLGALKGSGDPRARRRSASVLVAAQMAYCVFLLLAASLFVATFQRLVNKPLGFSDRGLILLQVEARDKFPLVSWSQLTEDLQHFPGVGAAAFAGWAPLTGNRWRNSVLVEGRPREANPPYFVDIAPSYFDTMQIGMIDGRDFRPGDEPPRGNQQQTAAGVGIVNEAFARVYFDGRDPVGKRVSVRLAKNVEAGMEIVGIVHDAAYDNVREPMRPTVYVPVSSRSNGAILVRAAGDPVSLMPTIRREVSRLRPDLRVRAVELQSAIVKQQMVRERLLATLSSFFALVALVLAGVGLYGMLNHAVVRQQREIGIRMALGARAAHAVRLVTTGILVSVCAGCLVGLAAGIALGRVVQSLLFGVKATDPLTLGTPILMLAVAAVLATLPPAARAARIDPAQTLRTE